MAPLRTPDGIPPLPRLSPKPSWRSTTASINTKTRVTTDGLKFTLTGGKDTVRLLGFTLTPHSPADTEKEKWILQRLHETGRYGSTTPLDSLVTDLAYQLHQNPHDAFSAYWLEQLVFLQKIEIEFVQRGWEWASFQTGLSMFSRYDQAVALRMRCSILPTVKSTRSTSAPVGSRRLLYWLGIEGAGRNEISAGKRDLAELFAHHPNDPLLAMYNGEKVYLPGPADNLDMAPDAPAWSIAQREALVRMAGVAHWWINERQAPNGELGGKYGDDVEIMRWWTGLVLSGDPVVFKGWKRLADGVWNSRQVHLGYAREVKDVEHASEFVADTAPLMVLCSDDPKYVERLRYSAEHMANLWTGVNPNGRRFFKSGWFSSTELNTEPPRDRDVEMNAFAAKAVRYLAWKTGDPHIINVLHEWSLPGSTPP